MTEPNWVIGTIVVVLLAVLLRRWRGIGEVLAHCLVSGWVYYTCYLISGSIWLGTSVILGYCLWMFIRWGQRIRRNRIREARTVSFCSILPQTAGEGFYKIVKDLEAEGFHWVADFANCFCGDLSCERILYHPEERLEATVYATGEARPSPSACHFSTRTVSGEEWVSVAARAFLFTSPRYVRMNRCPKIDSVSALLKSHRAFIARTEIMSLERSGPEDHLSRLFQDGCDTIVATIISGALKRLPDEPGMLRITWRGVFRIAGHFLRQPVRFS